MDLRTYLDEAPRGTAAAIARSVGVSPVMVTQWTAKDGDKKEVAAERCPLIERCTEGRVTVEELRDDINWQRVPDASWPHPEGRPCIDVAAPVAAEEAAEKAGA